MHTTPDVICLPVSLLSSVTQIKQQLMLGNEEYQEGAQTLIHIKTLFKGNDMNKRKFNI